MLPKGGTCVSWAEHCPKVWLARQGEKFPEFFWVCSRWKNFHDVAVCYLDVPGVAFLLFRSGMHARSSEVAAGNEGNHQLITFGFV